MIYYVRRTEKKYNYNFGYTYFFIRNGSFDSSKTDWTFCFFNVDRHRIQEKSLLESDIFSGAQLKYTWPELEPEKGVYNFDLIQSDLEFHEANGKNLFIQVQDVSFDTHYI